jgi:hypothetical protein
MVTPNSSNVIAILQNAELNVFTISNHNSQDELEYTDIQIPNVIPVGMVVAMHPAPNDDASFWLGKVIRESINIIFFGV